MRLILCVRDSSSNCLAAQADNQTRYKVRKTAAKQRQSNIRICFTIRKAQAGADWQRNNVPTRIYLWPVCRLRVIREFLRPPLGNLVKNYNWDQKQKQNKQIWYRKNSLLKSIIKYLFRKVGFIGHLLLNPRVLINICHCRIIRVKSQFSKDNSGEFPLKSNFAL